MSEFLPDQSTEDLSILFDTILQSVPDAMILIDEAGRVMAFELSRRGTRRVRASLFTLQSAKLRLVSVGTSQATFGM